MKISEVRIRKVENDDSKLKAVASVTIDECFVVHDIKIIKGESGMFIAMPSKKIRKANLKILPTLSILMQDKNCQTRF